MLDSMALAGGALLLLWLVGNALLVLVYRRDFRLIWRDPVFSHPILVVESDDWGAGPLTQAAALHAIADVLSRHGDSSGRRPVFNLALVLAVADGPETLLQGRYQRIALDAPLFAPVLSALRDGQACGVFAFQLHGMEHYCPAALLASSDGRVKRWLGETPPAATEQLPSHLQSRWVDASELPSRPLDVRSVLAAVIEEVRAFERILGLPPKVVVPPTFVWTRETELAWAAQGLECLVTPGWRYTVRNGGGLPDGDEGPFVNGDRAGGLVCLVRTDYFEPARGRDAAHALGVLDRAVSEGRPCLLENHRDNFIGTPAVAHNSLAELEKLYRDALVQYPDLRFLSSTELGRALRDRDPHWLVIGTPRRLPYLWVRLQHSGRLWKLMRLSGLAFAVGAGLRLAQRITRSGSPDG